MGCCMSCLRRKEDENLYRQLLADNERDAISALLEYLENRSEVDFFSDGPLKALSTLVYSDNIDLQRSAALAFAEITEKEARAVSREVLEPLLILLQSSDQEVQRAACAALGNLAINDDNKVLIVEMGGLTPLIRQMLSPDIEVQCNAVGCVTNLATQDANKAKIAQSGALIPLTRLAKSPDLRVQRNATGALLNMTHSPENRKQLVDTGSVPVLVDLLSSPDADIQYYCTTALSNIAVDAENRKMLAATEPKLVGRLVQLMDSASPRVQCQATLALRNLASDALYQLEIVRSGGLSNLVALLKSQHEPLVLAAVACIRNISIHPLNERPIVDAGFLGPLVDLVDYTDNPEIQCHAVSSLRNLAASSDANRRALVDAGAVTKCMRIVLASPDSVQSEISACFAILALADNLKARLLAMGILDVLIPLTRSQNPEVCGNSAAALANLCSRVDDYSAIVKCYPGISDFISRFLAGSNLTFEHIALWTVIQLLESGNDQVCALVKADIDHGNISLASASAGQAAAPDPGASSPPADSDPAAANEIANLVQQIVELVK